MRIFIFVMVVKVMSEARYHMLFVKSTVLQKDSTIANAVRDKVLNRFRRSRSYFYIQMPEYAMFVLYLPALDKGRGDILQFC